MSKRNAGNYLTDQNWDQEDDEEEAGIFAQASENTIKQRQIKKAKRRGAATGDGESGTGGAFKGFSGFGGLAAKPATSAPLFSFATGSASKELKGLSESSNGTPNSNNSAKITAFSMAVGDRRKEARISESSDHKHSNGTEKSRNRGKYLQQLKSLNESVSKWIKDHIDRNPYCVLTPVYKDYEKYLKEIEEKYPDESAENKKESADATKSDKVVAKPSESSHKVNVSAASSAAGFKFEEVTEGMKKSSSTPQFKFAGADAPNKDQASPFAGFGSTANAGFGSTSSPATSGFGSTGTTASSGFGSIGTTAASGGSGFGGGFNFKSGSSAFGGFGGGGLTFAVGKNSGEKNDSNNAAASNTGAAATEEEEYVPPKTEVQQITEEDSLYTKRCKLFYQKDGVWVEKGVGNLHLKPLGEKTQLLIRADTNLGNILLNIMLSSSMPMKRQGKNNVSIICVPNPPLDTGDSDKPASMLLRVKTADDAEELLEKLQKYKEGSSS